MSIVEAQTTIPVKANDGDHDLFSHVVVPSAAVTRAYITGEALTALCGKVWVPTRSPERYPVCPTCKDILKKAGHNV